MNIHMGNKYCQNIDTNADISAPCYARRPRYSKVNVCLQTNGTDK